jgi:hypothetical protein
MKKAYFAVAKFMRWVVAGVLTLVVAIPTLTSFSTSM